MLTFSTAFAQPADSLQQRRKERVVVISESAIGAASLGMLASAWYNQSPRNFHAFNDADEWLQIDKVGHFTTSYQIVRINSQLLNWFGIPEKRALNYSLAQTLIYMTSVEVLDGFSATYGASFSDLAANTSGVLVYWLQHRYHLEDAFNLKFSYRSSGLTGYRPELLGASPAERWLKDYNGQTYWLSLNLQTLTGSNAFPAWLNLAMGYGGTGMLGGKANPVFNEEGLRLPVLERRREWALSLDISTDRLFPAKKGVNRAFRLVSFLKIPLPGVVFADGQRPQWKLFAY
ncbi:MAG: DUF2279 domain-containing protein [Bacteroidota bacterium]